MNSQQTNIINTSNQTNINNTSNQTNIFTNKPTIPPTPNKNNYSD